MRNSHLTICVFSHLTSSLDKFVPAPRGMQKIVLSTNIAETGVTLPDVVRTKRTKSLREKSNVLQSPVPPP